MLSREISWYNYLCWALSSPGRASLWHREGSRFESDRVHNFVMMLRIRVHLFCGCGCGGWGYNRFEIFRKISELFLEFVVVWSLGRDKSESLLEIGLSFGVILVLKINLVKVEIGNFPV